MRRVKNYLFIVLAVFMVQSLTAQDDLLDYGEPKEFEIAGVKVTGAEFSDDNAIISISGFRIGEKIKIPGPESARALKSLWRLSLFEDIQIYKEKTVGDKIFLEIEVKERPRLSSHTYKGAKKSHHDDLNEAVNVHLVKGGIITENIKTNAKTAIRDYYVEKGFLDAKVAVEEKDDPKKPNSVRLLFDVNKGKKVKIQNITFSGNNNLKARKLRKQMEETHRRKKMFTSSKLIKEEYEKDKNLIIAKYNKIGFRDAKIAKDSIWREADGDLMMHLTIDEGNRYFFRNIGWKGNSIYDTQTLTNVLGINKGDVYNNELLQTRLSFSQEGRDVSTLYMDEGYLFFQA